MQIIRDEGGGVSATLLCISWNLKRCNIKDCTEQPTTIITETVAPVFALCENHYKDCIEKKNVTLSLEFD